jgi:hypothetical protein
MWLFHIHFYIGRGFCLVWRVLIYKGRF